MQEKLAKQISISRTPVCKAFMRLEQEGVLEISARGGFRQHRMDDHEVRELYQARSAVEGQAARILAGRCEEQVLEKLRETVLKEEDLKSKTIQDYFDANRNIHRRFVELTNNRYLLEMFDSLWGKSLAFQLFATFENVDMSQVLGDHLNLIDVIATGNKSAALEAFVEHISDGLDLQLKGLHAK